MAYKDPNAIKAWREANKERLAEKKREWYLANREKSIQRSCIRASLDTVKESRKLAYAAKRDAAGLPSRKPKSLPKVRVRKYSIEQIEKLNSARAQWKLANKDRVIESTSRRRAMKLCATPSWSSSKDCAAIYAKAALLTATTGVKHHVDHIVPMRSKTVCGLHVPANLQVLPAIENIVKGNRSWPDMP
jgi:hypothetical protein